jgi:integrase
MEYTVNFYLEKRKDESGNLIDKDMAINLFFSFDGKRMQFYTGRRIDLKKWDSESQRVKRNNVNKKRYTSTDINEHLTNIEAIIVKVYKESKALELQPSVAYLKEQLKERLVKEQLKNPPKEKEVTLLKLFDEFIAEQKKKFSPGYIKQLKSTKQHVENFAKAKNISLSYSGINGIFFDRFRDYFLDDLENTDNSFAGTIKRFKKFLNYVTDKKKNNKNFEWKSFTASEKYESPVIYLTWNEFMQLYNAKIENEHLQKVRDIFIFQSMTAMRYDDLYNLKKENLKDDCIEYIQGKTNKPVTVPYNEFTLELKEKYKDLSPDRPLPRMANQPFNVSLKILFKEAKLNRQVMVVTKKNNISTPEFKALHEVAASHMARRNFIGLSIEKEIRTEVIKSISGHTKDSKSFGRYYDITDKQKQEGMNVFKK